MTKTNDAACSIASIRTPTGGPLASRMPLRAVVLAVGLMAVISCSRDAAEHGERVDCVSLAWEEGLIPSSAICVPGVGPSRCVPAPPTGWSVLGPRMKVDGVLDEVEWLGATAVPYVDVLLKATGQVHIRVSSKDRLGDEPQSWLYLYLDRIPVYGNKGVPVSIFVDHRRWAPAAPEADPSDRVFELNLQYGGGQQVKLRTPDGSMEVLPGETFEFVQSPGGCVVDPEDHLPELWRCSGELRLPLEINDYKAPDEGIQPGFGLAVLGGSGLGSVTGSMPEAIAANAPVQGATALPWTNRAHAQTVLLGIPNGFQVKYVSWNVRQSNNSSLAGVFGEVGGDLVGKQLASWGSSDLGVRDVVALQEGWNEDRVADLVNAANEARANDGLPPLHAYGPVDFEISAWKEIVNFLVSVFSGGSDGTTGGLWVLSELPRVAGGFQRFTSCQGEDCFKAKGIQWVRLDLNPPSEDNSGERCAFQPSGVAPPGCGQPPSGDHYVDVFNLHLQNPDTMLCGDWGWAWGLLNQVLAQLIQTPGLQPWIMHWQDLSDANWNCDMNWHTVQLMQLQEAAMFIRSMTVDRPDRPVVVMGDFNINGKKLDLWGASRQANNTRYRNLLSTLGIGPLQPWGDEHLDCGPSLTDEVTMAPDDYSWDVDHGDLARDRTVNPPPWCTPRRHDRDNYKTGVGTSIGEFPGDHIRTDLSYEPPHHPSDYYEWADYWEGTERLDYILVRPAYAPDASDYQRPRWTLGKGARGGADEWSSPWPGPDPLAVPFGLLDHYSDHKPITVTLKHVQLAFPPPFHATWKHRVEFLVRSADASSVSDCYGCDALDLIPWGMHGRVLDNGSWIYEATGPGTECTDDSCVAQPDLCVWDWRWTSSHTSADVVAHRFMVGLEDVDSTSGPDALFTCEWRLLPNFPPVDHTSVLLDWTAGKVGLRAYNDLSMECGEADLPMTDNEPTRLCSGTRSPFMCFEVDVDELPPGDQ